MRLWNLRKGPPPPHRRLERATSRLEATNCIWKRPFRLHFEIVRDGDFLDSLRAGERKADTFFSLQAAHERPGLYDVLVQIGGLDDWTASRVEVTQGVCHVNIGGLEAVLTRRTL